MTKYPSTSTKLARAQVFQALQQWRDHPDTQQQQREKPSSYDALIAYQALAVAQAEPRDWLAWGHTALREGPRSLAMELAMVGSNIQRAKDHQPLQERRP